MDDKNTKSSVFTRKMVAGKIELSRNDVIRILGLIDEELEKEELSATALIYGGCALMLHGYDTRSTTDIDYVITNVPLADYSRVIDRVVERSNPPFKRSLFDITMGPLIATHFKQNEMQELNLFKNLNVAIASPKQLLAMKLFSARLGNEFHDLQDSVYLAKLLNITKAIDLKNVLLSYVQDSSVDSANKNPRNPSAIDRFILEVEKRLI